MNRRLLLLAAPVIAGLSASPSRADDTTFFEPATTAVPETLFGIDASDLPNRIEQALAEETGFSDLQSFTVHWDKPTFRCLLKTYELHDTEHGVCLVDVGAFQVAATALIVKKSDAFEVSIFNTMIE